MDITAKRGRETVMDLLETGYINRQKENEIKLFENIKTDISVIVSEQLRKRSKTEFELTSIEKKFIYLKNISNELEKLLKNQNTELKNEEELINNYFEYTTTNLEYIFIKYESIINDLTKTNNDMKLKLKNIREKELYEFQSSYESLKTKTDNLKKIKEHIIDIKNCTSKLMEEYKSVKSKIEIKKQEKTSIENYYNDLLTKIKGYNEEFENIKEKCNLEMNKKKQSSNNLSIIEEKIKELNNIIQDLSNDKTKVIGDLHDLEHNNKSILINICKCNNDLSIHCSDLTTEIKNLEKEIANLETKKESLNGIYSNLETKLKDISEMSEEKKKEDERYNLFVKTQIDELSQTKNKLKEKEKEYSLIMNNYNLIKKENVQLQGLHSTTIQKMEKVHSDINDYKNSLESQKKELIDIESMKEQNEKTKLEILCLIEGSEKLLQEQKNFFFKISKFLNLINLSNEEYKTMINERAVEKQQTYKKNYEGLNKSFNKLCNELKEKTNNSKNIQNEIDECINGIQKYEIEIQSINKEKDKIEQCSKSLVDAKNKTIKEIENRKKSADQKKKETKEMLKHMYQELKETMSHQFKTKHVEHNNFLMQGEKEKLECDFQLFKSEIMSSLEKATEEKKIQIIEKENELKTYQQKYSFLKIA